MQGGLSLKIAVAMTALSAGCTGGPKRVAVPQYEPEEIGSQAVELLDRDGDGFLSAEERQEAKSLESAMSRLDANRDKKLDSQEIAKRIQAYIDYRSGLSSDHYVHTFDVESLQLMNSDPFGNGDTAADAVQVGS